MIENKREPALRNCFSEAMANAYHTQSNSFCVCVCVCVCVAQWQSDHLHWQLTRGKIQNFIYSIIIEKLLIVYKMPNY